MTKRIVSILVLCSSLCGYAMQQPHDEQHFNTFCGVEISPETLPLFTQDLLQQFNLPAIRAWINAQKAIIRKMVAISKPLLVNPFEQYYDANGAAHQIAEANFCSFQNMINRKLAEYAAMNHGLMKNLSNVNYVVQIPGTNYVAQMAGRLHRVHNLLAANGRPYETPDQLCDACINDMPATYQTVSRFAGYLRAREAVQAFGLDKIHVPNTCLIGIDTDVPDRVNDDNSIVVQEIVNGVPVRCFNTQLKTALISPEHLRQIIILTIYASLWNIDAKLLFNPQTSSFVISNFEQPNNKSPYNFFYKQNGDALGLSRAGLEKLCKIFADVPALNVVCQRFNQLTDNELRQIASGTLPASIAARL